MPASARPAIVVLAGGLSSRMGGGDKALLPLAGRPLLAHVLARVTRDADDVAVSANGDPGRFAAFGLPVLADAGLADAGLADAALADAAASGAGAVPGGSRQGPLAGVLAGMIWAAGEGHAWLVSVPGDCPILPRDLIDRLVRSQAQSGAAIVCAASLGRVHHATALWPVSLAASLEQALASGVRRMQDFTATQPTEIATFDAAPTDPFLNLNTPAEFAQAEALLARG